MHLDCYNLINIKLLSTELVIIIQIFNCKFILLLYINVAWWTLSLSLNSVSVQHKKNMRECLSVHRWYCGGEKTLQPTKHIDLQKKNDNQNQETVNFSIELQRFSTCMSYMFSVKGSLDTFNDRRTEENKIRATYTFSLFQDCEKLLNLPQLTNHFKKLLNLLQTTNLWPHFTFWNFFRTLFALFHKFFLRQPFALKCKLQQESCWTLSFGWHCISLGIRLTCVQCGNTSYIMLLPARLALHQLCLLITLWLWSKHEHISALKLWINLALTASRSKKYWPLNQLFSPPYFLTFFYFFFLVSLIMKAVETNLYIIPQMG